MVARCIEVSTSAPNICKCIEFLEVHRVSTQALSFDKYAELLHMHRASVGALSFCTYTEFLLFSTDLAGMLAGGVSYSADLLVPTRPSNQIGVSDGGFFNRVEASLTRRTLL